ncbi:MAG TPA: hypothetical protein VE692_05770 [Nitrososphaera sp.]|jgi:hypothetical protein|nr:hypothetical protein [Nitrososphaera sp.]
MTDFLSTLTWLVLSSLIGQINNSIDNEPDQENDTGIEPGGGGGLGVGGDAAEAYEPIVQIIRIGIAAFSILLLSLSLTAYKKTALKSIIYAAIAFGLFALQTFFDYLQEAVKSFEQPYNDVIFYAMTLAILVLFFLGIVRRK